MISKNDLIQHPMALKPHVVLLGAGASRQAFPVGDLNGKKLPLMDDLVTTLELDSYLKYININPKENFETIFPKLDTSDKIIIEKKVFDYFSKLELPFTWTYYDKLLLSLREKDAIFTFNWDPLLYDAYQRNKVIADLPKIYFLHGNVRINSSMPVCPNCNNTYTTIPLLYPIEEKNYENSNEYIKLSWKQADNFFANAFTITIFGYSAPSTDKVAIDRLKNAWLKNSSREIEDVEVIDIMNTSIVSERWKEFIPSHHLRHYYSIEDSCILRYPRRSCEALYYSKTQGKPVEFITASLKELHLAIKEITKFEN